MDDKPPVNLVPPDVVKQIRLLHQQKAKPQPPFFKVEERDATGKATCRSCGEPINQGQKSIMFEHAEDHEKKPWLRTRGQLHAEDCGDFSGDWVKCPKCKVQMKNEDWGEHWREHKYDKPESKAASFTGLTGSTYTTFNNWPNMTSTTANTANVSNTTLTGSTYTTFPKKTASWETVDMDNYPTELLSLLHHGLSLKKLHKESKAMPERAAAKDTKEDRMRRDALVAEIPEKDLPSYHGEPRLRLPGDYKAVEVNTLGDAKFEGTMMSHCLANPDVHSMFRRFNGMGNDDWGGHFQFPPAPPAAALRQHMPNATDEQLEHISSRGGAQFMSLRDHNGLAKATWWEPSNSVPGTEIRELSGFANHPLKQKYEFRVRQYLHHHLEKNGMDEGKLEHIGTTKENPQGEEDMEYKPILNLKKDELPGPEENYQGEASNTAWKINKEAHCGQCDEDRKVEAPVVALDPINQPLPGNVQPSLKDKWMKLIPKDKKIDVPLDKVKKAQPDFANEFFALGHVGDDDGSHHMDEFEGEFAGDSEAEAAQKAHDTVSRGVEPQDKEIIYPPTHQELAKHMREWHMMSREEMEGMPDVALGLTHSADHEDYGYGHRHITGTEAMEKDFLADPNIQQGLDEMKSRDLDPESEIPECAGNGHGCCHGIGSNCEACRNGKHVYNWQAWKKEREGVQPNPEMSHLCEHCGQAIGKDDHDTWIDDTGGDACPNREDGEVEHEPDQRLGATRRAPSGLDPTTSPGNDTSMGDDPDQGEEDEMSGWQPRVDPNAGKALKDTQMHQLDGEARKLQRGMKGLDSFAGSWKNATEIVVAAPYAKELKKVRDALADAGWNEAETTNGYQFKAPRTAILEGSPNPNGIVNTHRTPSDHRAFKNFLSDLKRTTGFTWPPEREKKHDKLECLLNQGIDVSDYSPGDIQDLHDLAHAG